MRVNQFEPEPGVFLKMKETHFGDRRGFYLVSEQDSTDVWSSVTWNPVTMQMNMLPVDEYVLSETFIKKQNRRLVRECLDYLSEDKRVIRYINGCPVFKLRKELLESDPKESEQFPVERRLA